MKFSLIVASSCLAASTAFALPRECPEFQSAYENDRISQYTDDCGDECAARKLAQLRASARELDSNYDPSSTDEQIDAKYQPDHVKVVIGQDRLEGVTLFLGLKLLSAFFYEGTADRAPISGENGVAVLNGQRCSAPFAPKLSSLRQKSLCQGSVAYLRREFPQIQIDVDRCLGSDFWIGNLSDDITQATIIVMRQAQNPGDLGFLCSSTFDRKNDSDFEADCQVDDPPPLKIRRTRK